MEILKRFWHWLEHLMRIIITWFLRLFHKEISDGQWNAFMQFVKFSIVGLSNTVVSYVIFLIGVSLGIHYQVSNLIGYMLGILNSFFWNNRLVFEKKEEEERSMWQALAKVYASYAFSYVVSAVLLVLWVDLLHVPEFLGPIITVVVTTPINFILNKFWAFKGKKKHS